MNNHESHFTDVPKTGSSLKIMSWNINHINDSNLGDKTEIEEFKSNLNSAMIFCLQETKGEVTFQNYRCLNSLRQGSKSGGICIGVHRSLEKHIKHLVTGNDDFQAIVISPSVTGLDKEAMLINVYDSPENSSFKMRTKKRNDGDTITTLDALIEFQAKHNYAHVLITGDLNARTGYQNFNPKVGEWKNPRQTNKVVPSRASKDSIVNPRGKKLLDMISCCNLSILNGNTVGDVFGNLTCLKYNGASVVDYMIASRDLKSEIRNFQVLPMTALSDHRPILCTLYTSSRIIQSDTLSNLYDDAKNKPKWNDEIKQGFMKEISSSETTTRVNNLLDEAINSQNDVIRFNKSIINLISKPGVKFDYTDQTKTHPTQKPRKKGRLRKKPMKCRPKHKWYDSDCINLKRRTNTLGKKYGKNPLDTEVRTLYYSTKREYRKTLAKKKAEYKAMLNREILEDGKLSWGKVKSLKSCDRSISKLDLFDMRNFSKFFERLYSKKGHSAKCDDSDQPASTNYKTDDLILNDSVSEKEVYEAARGLKNGKAVGQDEVLNEQLKCICDIPETLSLLCKLFNECLDKGVYPWNTTVITPLFKKGDIYDPDCYRAIAVGSNLGKLFSQILLDRLIKFRSGKCPDTINQLGFCKGAQTVDHIFTLNTCIEKYVHHLKGNRLYTCFVDFRKAFDSIPREALLQKLSTYGINGKFFNCISYMYRNSNARIKMANKLSDLINIEAGTEQGHTLSPELFKLYIHDLSLQINAMQNTNCPSLSDIPITHLLWADDLVLMALDKSTLQSMIDKLSSYCQMWGLEVNTKKTAILVFNKMGRKLIESNSFTYENIVVPSVKEYCYLGITLSLSGSFVPTLKNLRQKGFRAYFGLKKMIDLRSISKLAVTKLIDTLILPVVTYGVPIWFAKTKAVKFISGQAPDLKALTLDPTEKLHISILKWTMGVSKYTSNAAVWGDFGRVPVLIRSTKQVINYMNRLKMMTILGQETLSRYAYEEQLHSCLPWMKRMEELTNSLDKNRSDSSLPNATLISARSRERFIDSWNESRLKNRKLSFYNSIKKDFTIEPYLTMTNLSNAHYIAKLRTSSHRLGCETGRYGYKSKSPAGKICTFCCDETNMDLLAHLPFIQPIAEDELHFLRTCPRYNPIRGCLDDELKTALFRDPTSLFSKDYLPRMSRFLTKLFKERFEDNKARQ